MLRIGSDFLVNPDKLESVDLIPAKPVQANGTADSGETTYRAHVAIYHSGGREHDLSFEGSTAEEADQAAQEVFDKIHKEETVMSVARRRR